MNFFCAIDMYKKTIFQTVVIHAASYSIFESSCTCILKKESVFFCVLTKREVFAHEAIGNQFDFYCDLLVHVRLLNL